MRINKYIAESGFCSRRRADKLIEEGRVTINGEVAKLGDQVTKNDLIFVDEEPVTLHGREDVFIAFNKPIGVISTADTDADNTVFDYIDIDHRLFYVGRLDVASSGLMLLTNNGDIANRIASAKSNVEKEYIVKVDRKITRNFLQYMRDGVDLDGRKTKPAQVKKMTDVKFKIILTEGRNRQIRRMCEALGYHVKELRRIRVANVKIRDLGAGNWRHLSKKERRELLALV